MNQPHVQIERVLDAPVGDVFAAWTDADSMSRWLSPTGRAEVDADVRVGGRFRITMIGDTRLEHTGEYLEVDPPKRLAFTWNSPYTGDAPTIVTVELAAEGDRTRLVLVHERLPEGAVEPHTGGWNAIIDLLAIELARGGA